MINAVNISFSYDYNNKHKALSGVDFSAKKGELAVILGRNGSGKSTLIKHLNGLLELQHGSLTVNGIDAANADDIWKLRRCVGMVFQNPDNQFVSSVVEEDVAFGLENYEVPREEIPQKVADALCKVGMSGYEKRAPHMLSGGQKQRVALAGVLALDPEILLFDEATAMLDPQGRSEVLSTVRKLHDDGKTVVMVTHYVEEALFADSVWIMSEGKMLAHGTPREMLTDIKLLAEAGLDAPIAVKLYYDLLDAGIELEKCPLSNEEAAEEICRLKYAMSR